MTLEVDIVERIQRDFSPIEAARALTLLSESGETGRIARCIVVAAQGSLDSLKSNIDRAKYDYRDAIMAGEYDEFKLHMRDLRVTLLIDSPEKMWISEVAVALHSRDYKLSSIETHQAHVGPFDLRDQTEGAATFIGDLGEIKIEKKDRQWILHSNFDKYELGELNHPIAYEGMFRDALSCFLAGKRKPNPNKKVNRTSSGPISHQDEPLRSS